MQPIAAALSRITLGAPAQFRNMTVFPLFAPPTGAPGYLLLDDALERNLARVTEVSESGTVPELLFVNEGDAKVLRVAGVELFDSDATFRQFMEKIVRSYAMDAIEEPRPEAKPPVEEVRRATTPPVQEASPAATPLVEEAVRRFLDDMKSAALQRFPALAEGEDLRIESETVAGGALCAQNRMVHLCAFHVEKRAGRPIGRGGRIDFEIPAFLRRTARSA